MRRSATALVILLLGVVACTDEQPRQEPASRSATSPSASSVVVPDVLGENFLSKRW
jgi:hypothetical protein